MTFRVFNLKEIGGFFFNLKSALFYIASLLVKMSESKLLP